MFKYLEKKQNLYIKKVGLPPKWEKRWRKFNEIFTLIVTSIAFIWISFRFYDKLGFEKALILLIAIIVLILRQIKQKISITI